ncbi:MAG: hypothetical protein AAGF26_07875 [Cyanobacteria bacterium P01_G01_bin.49]
MKTKPIVASLCLALSFNLFVQKAANAIDPFTLLFWTGVGMWMGIESTKDSAQEDKANIESIDVQDEDPDSNLDYDITFDEELIEKNVNSEIVKVSKGVIKEFATTVTNSQEISFSEDVRNNYGGSIGFAKFEQAITNNYGKNFTQGLNSTRKVSLDGNQCHEYLVQEKIYLREGFVVEEEKTIDFTIVDSVKLKATNLCENG